MFALDLYARAGVADACLALQDEAGVDVCLLLMALLAVRVKQRPLSCAEIQAADDAIGPWRAEIVHPLRTMRRRLKSGPLPAPSDATGRFRETIKACELQAERLQLEVLAAHFDTLPPGVPEAQPVDGPLVATARRVVEHCAARHPQAPGRGHAPAPKPAARATRTAGLAPDLQRHLRHVAQQAAGVGLRQ